MAKLKDMKYKLGRGLIIAGLAVLPFAGCKKDDDVTDQKPSTPAQPQPAKHNVELKYDGTTEEGCVNVAMDTIYKYNADPTVDSIFMIAEPYYQFANFDTRGLTSVVNYLRPRHNVNPNKVFGKGELQLWNQAVLNNPEIVRFFADTLKYNVTYRETASKSR